VSAAAQLNAGTAVVVMAKAPRAGQVKTRLIPALGADGAAALARRMLQHTLRQANMAAPGRVWLCGAPRGDDPAFALPAVPPVRRLDQGEGDLGARMAHAFAALLPRHARVLVVGTDCPALDAAVLHAADAALAVHDAVFVPALDGATCWWACARTVSRCCRCCSTTCPGARPA
jgi:rSAM/selenodomain-associated transferase 1